MASCKEKLSREFMYYLYLNWTMNAVESLKPNINDQRNMFVAATLVVWIGERRENSGACRVSQKRDYN